MANLAPESLSICAATFSESVKRHELSPLVILPQILRINRYIPMNDLAPIFADFNLHYSVVALLLAA